MPRNYIPDPLGKRYKKYDINILQQAIDEYQAGGSSLVNISKKYDISKSVLYRHCTRNMKSHGGQTVLSDESEKEFIKYINICADWGYPMEAYDLRLLVKLFLDRLGVTEKRFKNNMPGPDFVASFLKRHSNNISQRLSQNIKRNRAVVSPEVIKKYFQELQISIENVPTGNIINYGEINLSDDPDCSKIIMAKKDTKYPERVMIHSKSAVSVMMACTTEGDLLPPYVVYKAEHLYNTWTLKGPKGTRYNISQLGRFDATIFNDWVKSIALPYFEGKPGRKILIGDKLSSYLSIELIKLCHDQDVQFIFLPANSTKITQPLDAFFRPMKMAWGNIILQWKKTDGRTLATIPTGIFPQLFSKLMDKLEHNSKDIILSGFRKTGIYPFDPTQVLRRLSGDMTDVNQTGTVSKAEILKELRYGTVNLTKPKRKRKIEVEAGRSVNNFEKEKSEKEIKAQQILPGTSEENVVEQEIKKAKMEINTKKGKGIGKKSKINDTSQLKESTVITNTTSDDCLNINILPIFFEDNIEIDHTEIIEIQSDDNLNSSNVSPNPNCQQKNDQIVSDVLLTADSNLKGKLNNNWILVAPTSAVKIDKKVIKSHYCVLSDEEILKAG